jgi:hypothetical protein
MSGPLSNTTDEVIKAMLRVKQRLLFDITDDATSGVTTEQRKNDEEKSVQLQTKGKNQTNFLIMTSSEGSAIE